VSQIPGRQAESLAALLTLYVLNARPRRYQYWINVRRSQMSDNTLPTTTLDRHLRRLLRDLKAIETMEDSTRPTANERLTATLGEELLRVLRAEVERPLVLPVPSRRVA
jgi:hypothetical protein